MSDFLDVLARDAKETIASGYYQRRIPEKYPQISLKKAILVCKQNPIIAEIKAASPSLGTIRSDINSAKIAQDMQNAGAVGISVLTEPKHFKGHIRTLSETRESVKLPLLMKDIILSALQVDVGAQTGANAILLIEALYDRGYGEMELNDMIAFAHSEGLEVLLETHSQEEFSRAIETEADLVGINNRDLASLKTDLQITKQILDEYKNHNKLVVSESGLTTPSDLKFLRDCGANAFLIGSSIMLANNILEKVKGFVEA